MSSDRGMALGATACGFVSKGTRTVRRRGSRRLPDQRKRPRTCKEGGLSAANVCEHPQAATSLEPMYFVVSRRRRRAHAKDLAAATETCAFWQPKVTAPPAPRGSTPTKPAPP